MIKTGFYNVNTLSKSKQKKLMRDAICLSYNVTVQSKYSKRNEWRDIEPSISIKEALSICHSLKMVDRTIQYPNANDTNQGELSLINTNWEEGKDGWLLLYCFMSLPSLHILAEKYNLKMK